MVAFIEVLYVGKVHCQREHLSGQTVFRGIFPRSKTVRKDSEKKETKVQHQSAVLFSLSFLGSFHASGFVWRKDGNFSGLWWCEQ